MSLDFRNDVVQSLSRTDLPDITAKLDADLFRPLYKDSRPQGEPAQIDCRENGGRHDSLELQEKTLRSPCESQSNYSRYDLDKILGPRSVVPAIEKQLDQLRRMHEQASPDPNFSPRLPMPWSTPSIEERLDQLKKMLGGEMPDPNFIRPVRPHKP